MVDGKKVKNLQIWVKNDTSPYIYDKAVIYTRGMKQIIHITRKENKEVIVEFPIVNIKIMEYETDDE